MERASPDIEEPDQNPVTGRASTWVGPSGRKVRPRSVAPSLRPPTLMIDLLFGALMLFAFQMGDPSSRQVIPHDFDLPTADGRAANKVEDLLPLKPIQIDGGDWVYEGPDGHRLTAEVVVETVRRTRKTPVLLVASTAKVQSYIDAEQPLRMRGLKVGLAVALKEKF